MCANAKTHEYKKKHHALLNQLNYVAIQQDSGYLLALSPNCFELSLSLGKLYCHSNSFQSYWCVTGDQYWRLQ